MFAGTAASIKVYDISSASLLNSIDLDFSTSTFRFSPSGVQIMTDRGPVTVPGKSPPSSSQPFVTRSWIQESGEDIVAIPYAYRDSMVGVNGHSVAFQGSVDGVLFVRLDKGVKSMVL